MVYTEIKYSLMQKCKKNKMGKLKCPYMTLVIFKVCIKLCADFRYAGYDNVLVLTNNYSKWNIVQVSCVLSQSRVYFNFCVRHFRLTVY